MFFHTNLPSRLFKKTSTERLVGLIKKKESLQDSWQIGCFKFFLHLTCPWFHLHPVVDILLCCIYTNIHISMIFTNDKWYKSKDNPALDLIPVLSTVQYLMETTNTWIASAAFRTIQKKNPHACYALHKYYSRALPNFWSLWIFSPEGNRSLWPPWGCRHES